MAERQLQENIKRFTRRVAHRGAVGSGLLLANAACTRPTVHSTSEPRYREQIFAAAKEFISPNYLSLGINPTGLESQHPKEYWKNFGPNQNGELYHVLRVGDEDNGGQSFNIHLQYQGNDVISTDITTIRFASPLTNIDLRLISGFPTDNRGIGYIPAFRSKEVAETLFVIPKRFSWSEGVKNCQVGTMELREAVLAGVIGEGRLADGRYMSVAIHEGATARLRVTDPSLGPPTAPTICP